MPNNVVEFVCNNQKALVSYLYKLSNSFDTAEDIYQDVAEAVVRYPKDNVPDKDVPQYVYAITKRAYQRYVTNETNRLKGAEHVDGVDLTFLQLHEDKLDACSDPLEQLLHEDTKEFIPEAIESVVKNPEHANLLRLILCDDVTINTAADLCGLQRNHARVILFRFMQKIGDLGG